MYLYNKRELRYELFYANVIIIMMRRSVYVTDCLYTTKVASVDVNKQAFSGV